MPLVSCHGHLVLRLLFSFTDACIVVVDKENAEGRKGIFMIDASRGFMKDGNKNRLRERDIHKIVDVFTKQLEVPKYSRMVPVAEIANEKNDYKRRDVKR